MKFILQFLGLIFLALCGKSQVIQAKINKTGNTMYINATGRPGTVLINQGSSYVDTTGTFIPFVMYSGESNSGGQSQNADATAPELAVRSGTKILNNALLVLQDLDIGTNNLLQHNGMVNPELKHSWELEMANMQANGDFTGDYLYIAKSGQGGTRITQWPIGSSFANLFNTRANKMIDLLDITTTPAFALFYSQGINDVIAGDWNPTAWRDSTIARFNYIRSLYPDVPIIMQKFWPITGKDVTGLNAAMDYIVANMTNVGVINSDSSDLDDVYHDGYNSKKINAQRYVAKLYEMGYRL
jgi:hypothetical protein